MHADQSLVGAALMPVCDRSRQRGRSEARARAHHDHSRAAGRLAVKQEDELFWRTTSDLIVSRDSDYGLPQGDESILNDWLKAEFEARVKPPRKIELTPRLTVALKKLEEVVTPEDEAVETAVLEASRPATSMFYLQLEPRQTSYLTVPARAGPRAKKLLATLPGELDVLEYSENNGDIAFALTYPVSYEQGLKYGARLSEFAVLLGGERGLPPKFQ